MRVADERKLGSGDVEVNVMGFGGAPLGNMYEGFTDEQARATVSAAYDAGMRFFDTAPLYGHGLSEHRVGTALREKSRDSYVLSTKVGRLLFAKDPSSLQTGIFDGTMPFDFRYDYSYDGFMRSVEDSLQRLGTHRIDVLLVHDVDVWTDGSEEARKQRLKEVFDSGYKALRELRDNGTVGAIGAGMNESRACQDFAESGEFDCFLLAGRYTLLEQESLDEFLPLCFKKNIGIMIGGPYNTGILATGAIEGAYYNYAKAPDGVMQRVAKIEAVCKRHKVKLATAALHFPLHHSAVSSIIPGARTPDEVIRNKEIFEAKVPADLWAELKHEGLVRADAPTP